MYDYVIVGAGSAGCVLAARLSEDPETSVLLLEAGPPDVKENIHVPLGYLQLARTDVDWDYCTAPEANCDNRRLPLPRGKVLGGSSSVNAMIYIRGNRTDYDSWGEPGWAWDDLFPYFLRAEDNERGASEWHGAGGPLPVSDQRSGNVITPAFVDAGNEAGLETPDLMAYFAADPSVRVIVVYLEGVRNSKGFRKACKAARAAGKPVIALKLGASEGGRAAAMAHTGALAGSIETFDAISTREGVIRVRGLDELLETTECFVHADAPKGNRLAAVTLSGGKRGLLIDAFHAAGLSFADLSANASGKLAKMLGPGSIVGNPLDAGFAAVVDPSVYMQSIQIMIDDPDTDIVIIDAELPKAPHELRERNLRIVNEKAAAASKPVVYISTMSIGFTEFTKA